MESSDPPPRIFYTQIPHENFKNLLQKLFFLFKILSNRLALYVNQFTEYLYLRPFGASFYIGSYDPKNGCQLYSLNPAGEVAGWNACAQGKSKQQARTSLEKLDFSTVTVKGKY